MLNQPKQGEIKTHQAFFRPEAHIIVRNDIARMIQKIPNLSFARL